MDLSNYEKIKDMPDTRDGSAKQLSNNEQKDKTIIRDLAIKYPERLAYDVLLKDVRESASEMKSIIFGNSEAVRYMSGNLRNDVGFLSQIIDEYPGSVDTIKTEILKNCNVIIIDGKLVNDSDIISLQQMWINMVNGSENKSISITEPDNNKAKIMSAVIATNPAMILSASDTLRDNKDFVRTECFKSDKVIDTVVDNMDRFGTNGILGAQEANRDKGENECIKRLEDNLKQMTEILRANGLTDEQIQQDVIIIGIRNELSKLKGISVMQDGQREQSLDSYFQGMAKSGDEDILPEDLFHRASVQDKFCTELTKRRQTEKGDKKEAVMEL